MKSRMAVGKVPVKDREGFWAEGRGSWATGDGRRATGVNGRSGDVVRPSSGTHHHINASLLISPSPTARRPFTPPRPDPTRRSPRRAGDRAFEGRSVDRHA